VRHVLDDLLSPIVNCAKWGIETDGHVPAANVEPDTGDADLLGGNLTGLSDLLTDLAPKQLEISFLHINRWRPEFGHDPCPYRGEARMARRRSCPAANADGKLLISRPESRLALLVVPTDEELMIAQHTLALLPQQKQQSKANKTLQGDPRRCRKTNLLLAELDRS
jgi:hypothetical protein